MNHQVNEYQVLHNMVKINHSDVHGIGVAVLRRFKIHLVSIVQTMLLFLCVFCACSNRCAVHSRFAHMPKDKTKAAVIDSRAE